MSQAGARLSRNIAARATVSAVIFDSAVPEAEAQGVYLEAVAEQLSGADLRQPPPGPSLLGLSLAGAC